MREILFKAKRIDNGEWVEGYFSLYPDGKAQIGRRCDNPPDSDPMWRKINITYEVDPQTVCQYTGLTDKNGNKIYENDVFKHYNRVSFEDYEFHTIGLVEWDEILCRYTNKKWKNNEIYLLNSECVYEVIGNKFDNPELLEGGE